MSRGQLSRRRLLGGTALAGALGCRPASLREAPDSVEFRGQSPERGHLLRSGKLLDSPVSARERAEVVIVGGGVAGLCAAWHLRRAGLDDVLLLELEPEFGGTARSGELPRSSHPMGAHYLPAPPRECVELHELLADLGLIVGRSYDGAPEYRSTAICPAPLERHFWRDRWFPGLYPEADESPAEAEQRERFWGRLAELDGARDESGRRLFRLPVQRSSPRMRALDRMSMADWLAAEDLTSWRLRWFVDYACRDDYGCSVEQTSAFAGLHHFLARGLEDRRESVILTAAGGNGELVVALRDSIGLGPRLRTDQLVYAVDPERGELRVHDFASARSYAVTAGSILWAAPRFALSGVLPTGRDPLAPGSLSYAPWLVANLELERPPGGIGASLAWDNVPIIAEPHARNLGYVVATHNEDRLRAHEPGAVISFYRPLVPDGRGSAGELAQLRAELLALDAREWGERVLRDLEHMHGNIRRHTRALHLHRWGHAMVRPIPGLLFGDTLAQARAPIGRVHPCAADVAGLPLFEEAFYSARAASEWALARAAVG